MDFWPKDDRNASYRQREYPYLEPGLIGATRLANSDGRLEWDFLFKNPSKDVLESRLKPGRRTELYPPTRQTTPDTSTASNTTIRQRAEQGANFLRTYLPDVDITADLIREHLTEEANLERKLAQFDPLSGNVLSVLSNDALDDHIILFPVGDLSSDLNISLLQCTSEAELVFKRWDAEIHPYPTPIRQIESNYHATRVLIAVRTFGDTYISALHPEEKFATNKVGALHTSNQQLVDVHLSRNGIATTITENGLVLQYDVSAPKTMHLEAFQKLNTSEGDDSDYWHLVPSIEDDTTFFVMSPGHLFQTDMRSNSTTSIFSLPTGRHLLTSAESLSSTCIAMSSTQEIIWLDTRFPNRPLLSFAHGRQFDRTLRLLNLRSPDDRHLCALHSRFNSMMTIYDVSKTQDQPLHMNDAPYFLPFETLYDKSVSKSTIKHRDGHELLCLGEDGRVTHHSLRLSLHDLDSLQVKTVGTVSFAEPATNKIDGLSQCAYSQVDVSESTVLHRVKQGVLETPEDIRHATDQFPRYLQSTELPIETLLTTYDVAFRSGTEPDQFCRSDFLASSSIKSEEGFQALLEGKFSPSLIKAPFKVSISNAISMLGTRHTDDPVELYNDLKRRYTDDNPKSSQQQQHAACRKLTLDLALSSTVLHEQAIIPSKCDDQDLEAMAGALSITDEPPPYVFGYLKPLEGFSKTSYDEERKPLEPPDLPIGIRLLMKTWDTCNPYDYEYHDPYGAGPSSAPTKKPSRTPDKPLVNVEPPQPRPPAITVAMPPTLLVEPSQKLKPVAQSQDVFPTRIGMQSGSQPLGFSQNVGSSQTPFASTQVVAGPFGGRPQLKKKAAKKRIGGF